MRADDVLVSGALRRRWTAAFVVGEMLAFVAPAVCGATLAAVGSSDVVLVVGLTLAGLLEGMSIGVAQARVLARFAPRVNGRDWVVVGYTQWMVLRRTVAHSGRWVWVTAGAWLLGVAIPVAALSTAPNSWPGRVHAGIGVLAAMAMGLTVGALTGRTLERLLDASVFGRLGDASDGAFPLADGEMCEAGVGPATSSS